MSSDINVTALVKGDEKYVFLYADSQVDQLGQVLGRFASHKDLSFNWYDAAVVMTKARAVTRTPRNRIGEYFGGGHQ
jgi:hypothetical protein